MLASGGIKNESEQSVGQKRLMEVRARERGRSPHLRFLDFLSPTFSGRAVLGIKRPFPSGMVGHFLKPKIRAQHEGPGFLTARHHVKRPLGLACR